MLETVLNYLIMFNSFFRAHSWNKSIFQDIGCLLVQGNAYPDDLYRAAAQWIWTASGTSELITVNCSLVRKVGINSCRVEGGGGNFKLELSYCVSQETLRFSGKKNCYPWGQGSVSQKTRKLVGPVKPFLVHLYLRSKRGVRLNLIVWTEPLFILRLCE